MEPLLVVVAVVLSFAFGYAYATFRLSEEALDAALAGAQEGARCCAHLYAASSLEQLVKDLDGEPMFANEVLDHLRESAMFHRETAERIEASI